MMKRSAFLTGLKYSFSLSLIGLLILFAAFDIIHRWTIKDDFSIKFTHVDAQGVFKKFEGEIVFDEKQPSDAFFDVKVQVNSVESGNPMRNESISNGWLKSESYPYITFKSTGAELKDGKWQTTGKLGLHGVTKEIVLPFTFTASADSALFESSFTVKMIDYHLSDNTEESIQVDLRIPVSK